MKQIQNFDLIERFINKEIAFYWHGNSNTLKLLLQELGQRQIKWQSGCFANEFMPSADKNYPFLYWNRSNRLCLFSKRGIEEEGTEKVDISRLLANEASIDASDILNLL